MHHRRLVWISMGLLVGMIALGPLGTALAQTGPAAVTCGEAGYGPGMMGPGSGYGPGMMGPGYGPRMVGPGMWGAGFGPMWSGTGAATAATSPTVGPASLDEAQQAFQTCLDQAGNPDLMLDEIMEFQQNFYAVVKEQSTGIGAMELLIDKRTGAVTREPGPDMMWNTKYGHRSGWTTPDAVPTVSAQQAQTIAQEWLDANQPGSTTETPDAFHGYYTVHTLRDGTVSGMLSVNAFSGQVWYHAWHGAFIAMREIEG
ncbi:MAG: hypothetical protein AB7P40_10020 [Chloroflexota bacterium]